MDFNTGGSSGRSDDRPQFGGETGGPAGGPARGPAGGAGGEFNLQDPVGSFVSAVRDVVLNPVGFFRSMARRGDFVNPLVFALICYLIYTIIAALISLIFVGLVGFGDPDVSREVGIGSLLVGFILAIVLAPFWAAITLAVFAGIYHLLTLLIIGPENSGFEATTRVVSYAFTSRLIHWLPVVGFFLGWIYFFVLSFFGLREAHNTTAGKAAIVVLIPVAIGLIILALIVVLFGALLLTLLGQQ